MGHLFREKKDYRACERWFSDSLREKVRLGLETGSTLQQLALVALEVGDLGTSASYSERALMERQKLGDTVAAAGVHQNIGMVFRRMRRFVEAEQHLLAGLRVFEERNDFHHAAHSYAELGLLAKDQRQNLEAGRWLIKALRANQINRDIHRETQLIRDFAEILRLCNEFEMRRLQEEWSASGLTDIRFPS